MALNPTCPNCGFVSSEVRCPRCNTLKVMGCSGSCFTCGSMPACMKRLPDEATVKPETAEEKTED